MPMPLPYISYYVAKVLTVIETLLGGMGRECSGNLGMDWEAREVVKIGKLGKSGGSGGPPEVVCQSGGSGDREARAGSGGRGKAQASKPGRSTRAEHQGRAPGQSKAPEPCQGAACCCWGAACCCWPINPSQAASVSPLFLGYFPGANMRHPDFCAKIRVFFGPCGELAFF